MPVSLGVRDLIAGIPVPKSMQKAFLETSKAGQSAILPLEGAVTIGRTVAETKRSGLLGFQERFFEESAAAFIWLYGVGLMQKVFDKAKPRFFKQGQHLSGDIAWNLRQRGLSSVDLTPQELYTRDAKEISQLIRIKSMRWAFSVGLALAGVAYVVPKLNQWKTNLLLKHMYAGKAPDPNAGTHTAPSATPAVTSPVPPASFHSSPTRSNFSMLYTPPKTTGFIPAIEPNCGLFVPGGLGRPQDSSEAAGVPTRVLNNALPVTPASSSATQSRSNLFNSNSPFNPWVSSTNSSSNPQFGLLRPTDLIQGLGYAVEHTNYGELLAVDGGIVLGRAKVANERSKYEAVETVFRDVVSLYFYILCAPHIMKLLGKAMDPAFGTAMQLQPAVAEKLTQTLQDNMKQQASQWWKSHEQDPAKQAKMLKAFESGVVPKSLVLELLQGSQNAVLKQPTAWLRDVLRQSSESVDFMSLFEKELQTYGWDAAQAQQTYQAIQANLKSGLNTQGLASQLTNITKGEGVLANLTTAQRTELSVALKNAFRHTAGVTVDLSDKVPKLAGQPIQQVQTFQTIWNRLSEHEQTGLMNRFRREASLDGLDQANTMLRRSLNLWRETSQNNPDFEAFETMLNWVDEAVARRLTLDEAVTQRVESLREPLTQAGLLKANEPLTAQTLQQAETTLAQQGGLGKKKLLNVLKELNLVFKGFSNEQPLQVQFKNQLMGLVQSLNQQSQLPENAKAVLTHYQGQLDKLISGQEGRLFSLATQDSDEVLNQKLAAILQGGLQNDGTFNRQAQDVLGKLALNSKDRQNLKLAKEMQQSMGQYGQKLLNRLDEAEVKLPESAQKLVQWDTVAENFQRLNRNLNYGGRLISMTAAMLSLGILVPKMQYLLTRRLTGKDENPGLASAERRLSQPS